jgi:hypothetical protein
MVCAGSGAKRIATAAASRAVFDADVSAYKAWAIGALPRMVLKPNTLTIHVLR